MKMINEMGTAKKPSREETVPVFKPEIVVLFCRHCVVPDADLTIAAKANSRFQAKLVMMPCTKKVEASHLLKILAQGADGVEVVGCPFQQCQTLSGSLQAEKRLEHARRLLRESGLEAERLGMERGLNLSGLQLVLLAEKRADAVRPLGPNPVKGTRIQ